MDRCRLILFALLLGLAASAHVEGAAQAPDPSGAVEGVVFDSTRSEPLGNARVVLWQTEHHTTTDSAGRFRISDVPPGEYSMVFFHERLARLGVSSGTRMVQVRSGSTSSVDLGTPSMLTIQTTQCVMERGGEPSPGGTATGRVRDSRTGVALPRARVELTWRNSESGQLEQARTTVDGDGWYRFCEVPRDQVIGATAHFLDRSGPRREFQVGGSGAVRVDFGLSELAPSAVGGVVLDAESEEPVSDAEVRLVGTEHRSITSDEGGFRFAEVAPGTYTVEITHLSYGSRTETVQVGTGLDVHIEVDVSMQPVELDPIRVTAESHDMEEALAMGGYVISRDEIEEVRHRSRDVGDLLRSQHIRGFVLRRQGNDVCAGFMPGQARIMKSNCQSAAVYIDGVRQSLPRVAMDLQAEAVDRIILYRPIEAGTIDGLAGGAGVIKIFTRSANRRPPSP